MPHLISSHCLDKDRIPLVLSAISLQSRCNFLIYFLRKSADHPARKWTSTKAVYSAESLLKESCPTEYQKCKIMIRTSFGKFTSESPLHPSNNGFVRATVDDYCEHHHLTLRPQDIWFAILTQLSFYINAHAEELRSFFVAHEGQKELEIKAAGSTYSADFGAMARRMTELMSANVVDPELRPWIMPAFSTTTETDKVVASIIDGCDAKVLFLSVYPLLWYPFDYSPWRPG